jgi:hypothetical protein
MVVKSMSSVLPEAAFQPCLVEPILMSPGRRMVVAWSARFSVVTEVMPACLAARKKKCLISSCSWLNIMGGFGTRD